MYLQLAWRNIWRNPRRTLVIMTAVIIGIWSMVFLGALMRGMVVSMLENGKATLTGDIQIHQLGFRLDPSIELTMTHPDALRSILEQTLPPGSIITDRIRVSAVISNARHSQGITLAGIAPRSEARISFIGNPLAQGTYLEENDMRGILVGQALLDLFETEPGKKLILTSRDALGGIASRAFIIRGVFNAEMEDTEKSTAFVSLAAAQAMLRAGSGISEAAILLPGGMDAPTVAARLKENLDPAAYEIHTWQELLPMLSSYLDMFDGFMYIWFLVIFVAMGFGIVNTTLMAVFERIREFGLLKSLGMKPFRIIVSVLTESFLLLVMGIAAGNILGILSISALADTGIDLRAFARGAQHFNVPRIIFPSLEFRDLAVANLTVMLLGLLVCLYPAIKAARITPVEAMRTL